MVQLLLCQGLNQSGALNPSVVWHRIRNILCFLLLKSYGLSLICVIYHLLSVIWSHFQTIMQTHHHLSACILNIVSGWNASVHTKMDATKSVVLLNVYYFILFYFIQSFFNFLSRFWCHFVINVSENLNAVQDFQIFLLTVAWIDPHTATKSSAAW